MSNICTCTCCKPTTTGGILKGKKIVIDAGHGRNTAGKRPPKSLDKNDEWREWTLNQRIASIVVDMLTGLGASVLRTDDITGKTDISLTARVNAADAYEADYLVSIHHNAAKDGVQTFSGGGRSVYYAVNLTERKAQAELLYKHLNAVRDLKGNRATPISKANFTIIARPKCPALLLENGFMDSTVDYPVIIKEDFARATAEGIVNFLKEVLS